MKITRKQLRRIIREAMTERGNDKFEAEFDDYNGPSKFNFEYLVSERKGPFSKKFFKNQFVIIIIFFSGLDKMSKLMH